MGESKVADAAPGAGFGGPYTVYSAGGLFTQHELAANVLIKEAVWRLSNGRFRLFLPQSREVQELDRPDVEAHIRNTDLLEVVRADAVLARFDGLELESGTVVEFATAKMLGKPTVVLRSDFRRVHFVGPCEPYNLMAKNWPRTVDVHLHSFALWASLLAEDDQAPGDSDASQALMRAELGTLRKSVDEVAEQVIAGLEAVLKMESPYPPDYREVMYEALRYSPGSGFDQVLTAGALGEIIERLRKHGTL